MEMIISILALAAAVAIGFVGGMVFSTWKGTSNLDGLLQEATRGGDFQKDHSVSGAPPGAGASVGAPEPYEAYAATPGQEDADYVKPRLRAAESIATPLLWLKKRNSAAKKAAKKSRKVTKRK